MRRSRNARSCLHRRRLRSREQSDDHARCAPAACAARRAPADLYALRPRRRRAGVPRVAIAGTAARHRRRRAASPATPPRVREAAGGGRDPRDSREHPRRRGPDGKISRPPHWTAPRWQSPHPSRDIRGSRRARWRERPVASGFGAAALPQMDLRHVCKGAGSIRRRGSPSHHGRLERRSACRLAGGGRCGRVFARATLSAAAQRMARLGSEARDPVCRLR